MTREEALEIARQHHLEEVEFAINQGMTPEEALDEWDLLDLNYYLTKEHTTTQEHQ